MLGPHDSGGSLAFEQAAHWVYCTEHDRVSCGIQPREVRIEASAYRLRWADVSDGAAEQTRFHVMLRDWWLIATKPVRSRGY